MRASNPTPDRMQDRAAGQAAMRMAAVLAVAFAARLISLLSLRGDIAIRVPLLDSLYYMQTAEALARGAGWPAGPHFMAPVYPFLLSGLFHLAPASVEAVQWAQLLLGLATTAVVYLTARRVTPDAALVAGMLYALCGPAIAYENQVLMESLLAFALAIFVWISVAGTPPGPIRSVLAGAAIGVAAAGRPAYALLLPAAIVILGASEPRTRGSSIRDVWRSPRLFLCLVGFLAIVVPPSVRNTRETGRLSFVTTSGGLNLYIGNHAGASGIYSQPQGLFLEKDPTGTRSASQMAGRSLTPDQASRFYAERAGSYVTSHPGAALRLWVRKAAYFLSPEEIPQIESFDQLRSDHPAFRFAGPITFVILFPLALMGAFRRWRTGAERTRAGCIAVTVAGALTHMIFFSTGRYRAALLPAIAVLAGGGAYAVLEAANRRSGFAALRRLWPAAVAILILVIAPRYDRSASLAWTRHQAGIRYEQIGADRTAEQLYLEALDADSTLGESWHNLAACQVREGRTADAIQNYERALRHLGENPVTLYNLAVLYGSLNMDERALGYFDRSVAADPAEVAVRVDRGIALYRLGRRSEAIAEWRRAHGDSPGDSALIRTIGRLNSLGADLPPDLSHLAPAR